MQEVHEMLNCKNSKCEGSAKCKREVQKLQAQGKAQARSASAKCKKCKREVQEVQTQTARTASARCSAKVQNCAKFKRKVHEVQAQSEAQSDGLLDSPLDPVRPRRAELLSIS